jgi:hypothetical protein
MTQSKLVLVSQSILGAAAAAGHSKRISTSQHDVIARDAAVLGPHVRVIDDPMDGSKKVKAARHLQAGATQSMALEVGAKGFARSDTSQDDPESSFVEEKFLRPKGAKIFG